MAALIGALDNYTCKQLGENGTTEYAWSNDIRERIVQLSFQLTRTKDISNLSNHFELLLSDLQKRHSVGKIPREEFIEYMSLLYKMVGHTRDIIDGKGEYELSYMLLYVWHKFYPELAKFALKQFILLDDNQDLHPYGSWKDIKYLYKYVLKQSTNESSVFSNDLVAYGIQLVNDQLKLDFESNTNNPSLVAKWVPREKSQFADLFTQMAMLYFSHYISTAKTNVAKSKAILKAKMEYRKIISELNRKLDTVQIKQCANTWSEIEPQKQTSITMLKQKKAFLNLNKDGSQRYGTEERILCAKHFEEFISSLCRNECAVNGKRIGLNDFTKEALKIIGNYNINSLEAQLLNAQWLDNSSQTGALGKMIAMVDVSGSMNGDPLHAAIALGIRVAEKSMLGKRILTFSALPTWVNLDGDNTFIEMVQKVKKCDWGLNTSFSKALMLILDAIVENKMAANDVEDMVLAIFSDMQIDQAKNKTDDNDTMMSYIQKQYHDAGIKVCGKPYKPPHILFWNLRSTSGFPTLSLQSNTSMMSGFSPSLLNIFCDEGLTAIQSCTPWSLLIKALSNERYSILDKKIKEFL
jgi:hypothetical protein